MKPAEVETTAVLRVVLRHAGQLAELAGDPAAGRQLALTRVNLSANLTCVFKALRLLEPQLLGRWAAASRLGPGPAGVAVAALAAVRLSATLALAAPERGLAQLRAVELWLRSELERVGQAPRGKIQSEVAAIEEALRVEEVSP